MYGQLKPGVPYLAYTHETIIHELQKHPEIKLEFLDQPSTKNLAKELQAVVGRDCNKCDKKNSCPWRKWSERNRTFQTIKITVSKEQPR